ncbi:MAG: rod shape-determining protein MreD [Polyangiales bacterium]
MRSLFLVAFGFVLLALQAALATLIPMHTFTPNLMLPIALALGASPEVNLVRGALLCFVLGYLFDAFCGNPLGLQTFVLEATYMLARGASVRLLPHGPMFIALFSLLMSVVSGFAVLSLRALFEKKSEILTYDIHATLLLVFQSALATAVLAPPLFAAVRRIEARLPQKADERASLL